MYSLSVFPANTLRTPLSNLPDAVPVYFSASFNLLSCSTICLLQLCHG